MNVPKTLFKIYKIVHYINSSTLHNRRLSYQMAQSISPLKWKEQKLGEKTVLFRKYSNISEVEEITGVYPHTEPYFATLFANEDDIYAKEIKKCASVEEVFTFIKGNIHKVSHQNLTQIVSVLYDLKTIFNYHYGEHESSKDLFFKKLLEHQEFYILTEAIQANIEEYEPVSLSYTLLHLNKLGLSEGSNLIQNIALKLRDHLLDNFSLSIATRLIRVIFNENSVRPYYIVIDLIPKIFQQIELIDTPNELNDLTICLYKMSNILTEETLNKYVVKVNSMMNENKLTGLDYQVLNQVVTLFNLPQFRYKLSSSISRCILKMKDSIEILNINEMCQLYDVFFKNQEPGEVLNVIQRAATKLLYEIEDTDIHQTKKLTLFSSIIFYSSPINKNQFRQEIGKYLRDSNTLPNLIILRKILSYIKIFDTKLCEAYWDVACKILKAESDQYNTQMMESYLYFCSDMPGYKHYGFEHHILDAIEKENKEKLLTLYPYKLFSSLAFALVCSCNPKFINNLIKKFTELAPQLQANDIFKISYGLQILSQKTSYVVTERNIKEISAILHTQTARIYANSEMDPISLGFLIKSAILRNNYDNQLINDILVGLKETPYMSSKLMEIMCYSLQQTKSLIPEVVNLCTNYILQHKTNIIGFNVEKIMILLFEINYLPVYDKEFFQTVTDIIIRDQERMSGLGFLQAALSLCFFNQMPKSFVKQIFNVEFLDKIDMELASCYFRNIYPRRVRNVLMQLNRSVCLEYPEYNVPWFHQKYIEEYQKNAVDDVVDAFHKSVKGYLIGTLGSDNILENVITPYGYEINFVFHLDKNKNLTTAFDDPQTTKYALLLKNDAAFTRFYVRLRGRDELKNRHLEILGYKVEMITENTWTNLLYAEERVEYINQLVLGCTKT
ncbi:FAST kinase domain-containing protein 1, mitochondrial isoform X2 [Euwallacea fornicatus]|uniref:FAST kinase domain-containing protein 1, mitochondrial isoform X2 n=1 Tax=Euwallacea fornicatus TaxID=995702 RepID=UPI00338DE3E9